MDNTKLERIHWSNRHSRARLWYFSWPAVSHIWNFICLLETVIILLINEAPICERSRWKGGMKFDCHWNQTWWTVTERTYCRFAVRFEVVGDKSQYKTWLSYTRVAQQYYLRVKWNGHVTAGPASIGNDDLTLTSLGLESIFKAYVWRKREDWRVGDSLPMLSSYWSNGTLWFSADRLGMS